MGAKKITYTIGFKPQEQDLQNIRKQLQELSKNTAIKSNPKALQQLTALQQHTEDLLSTLGRVMNGDGRVSKSMFTQLSRQLQGLQTETKGFANTMRSIGLSPKAVSEVKELDAQLDQAKAKLKEYRSIARGVGTGFKKGKDGQLTPDGGTQNKAARAAAAMTGMAGPNGRSIRGFKDFNAALNEVGRESEEGKRLLEAYTQAMNAFETAARESMSRAQGRIKGQQATISDLTTRRDAAAAAGTSPLVGQAGALDSAATQLLADNAQQLADAQKEVAEQTDGATGAQRNFNKAGEKGEKTLQKTIGATIVYRAAMGALRTLLNNAISTIKDMDKALTEMTVVTNLSRDQAWGLTNQLSELAAETGMTTTAVANMTTKYLQQGKTLADAITLTEAAAKAARIAGISGEESINLLTNAMNGFQLSADKAMEVSDKFASLAASSATDYEELATALSKVASQANLAGMSMDFTLGLLAKGIETTREAPETIGTALKTVISRMRELTDYGETLEDGTDINRVEAALKNVGVALRDDNGEFRDLDDVLSELGGKWEDLNKNQQANVAVALAGTRQQSRLIAMMQDFDRTQELVNISMNSAGATAAQHRKYMEGLEAATTKMSTAYQNLITNFTNSDIAIAVVNGLSEVLGFLANNIWLVWTALGAWLAIATVLKVQTGLQLTLTQAQNKEEVKKLGIIPAIVAAIRVKIAAQNGEIVSTKVLTNVKKLETKELWKNFTAWVSTNWILLIVVAAIALVVAAIVIFAKNIETSAEKGERLREEIGALNEEIYDLKTQKNTLTPLMEEMDQLRNKTIKTTEDLQRMQEITQELSQMEGFSDDNGNVLWGKIAEFVNGGADKLIAIKTEELASKTEELAQIWTDRDEGSRNQIVQGLKGAGLSGKEARKTWRQYKKLRNQGKMDEANDLINQKLGGSDSMASITASAVEVAQNRVMQGDYSDEVKAAASSAFGIFYGNLQNVDAQSAFDLQSNQDAAARMNDRIIAMEQELSQGGTMAELAADYKRLSSGLTDSQKEAFQATYAGFAELARYSESTLNNFEAKGLSVDKITSLKDAYLAQEGKTEAQWDSFIKSATADDLTYNGMVLKMMQGNSQVFKNKVEDLLVKDQQAITEDLLSELNRATNIAEMSKKYAEGNMTADEFRKFAQENEDLFADAKFVESFKAGIADVTKIREDATKQAQIDLELNKQINEQEISRLEAIKNRTAAQQQDLDDLYSQRAILEIEAEQIRYAWLYETAFYEEASKQTEEFKKQKNVLADILELEEKRKEIASDNYSELITNSLEQYKKYTARMQELTKPDGLLGDDFQAALKAGAIRKTDDGYILNEDVLTDAKERGEGWAFTIGTDWKRRAQAAEDYDEMEKGADESLEQLRDDFASLMEAQVEYLEKQQETYETYFDQLDQLREDEERQAQRDAIAGQIAAISGGVDSTSKSQLKELRASLRDLEQEQLDAERERQREAFMDNIQKSVDEINEHIEEFSERYYKSTTDLSNALRELAASNPILASALSGIDLTAYATGGLVDYTGPAWVDGTKTRPEAFLNPIQTNLIARLVAGLEIQGTNPTQYLSESSYSTVTIGSITIQTNELNTAQDFAKAGETMAESLQRAMSARGIIPNVKR